MEQESEAVTQVSMPEEPKKQNGGIGATIGIVIIIILLALGGVYYFTTGVEQIPTYEQQEQDAAVEALENQGTSSNLADIEADVNATDLSETDLLIDDIEADLDNI